jgi:methyltransferase
MDFAIFISVFILQRLSELVVARKNEKWLRANGSVEYGQKHYPFIVLLHTFFIISMIVEYLVRTDSHPDYFFLVLFIVLILSKIWVISSLGKFWNTKILRIPGMAPIKKGAYRYFKHPNYIIVMCEFIVVPMVFHLYGTAIIFSILNAAILNVRIREEKKVWRQTIS